MNQKIEHILSSDVAIKVLKSLYSSNRGVTGREIASMVGYSPQTVLNVLKILEGTNLITSQQVGKAISYQIQPKHWLLTDIFIPAWQTLDSWRDCLAQTYIDKLKYKPLSIIMFGSYAKGEEKERSDIDLFFIYEDAFKDKNILEDMLELNPNIFEKFGIHPSCKASIISEFKKEVKKGEGLMRTIYREGKSIFGLTPSEVIGYDGKKYKNG
jgi:predicted nucleotidyltransferase/DNA-binding transcriptional ArsR family regulator